MMRDLSESEKAIITKNDLLYEQRMTRVETTFENMNSTMKELRTDYRFLITIMIAGFSGLFGLMAHGFKWF